MAKTQLSTQAPCPIARALAVIGERWSLLILRNAFLGVRRFEQFQTSLDIPRPMLSLRLKHLVEAGVLCKVRYQSAPARYEYQLSASGEALYPVLLTLAHWGNQWVPGAEGVGLLHTGCGTAFVPVISCATCGEPVHARDMQPLRAPWPPQDASSS